jgi:hypothetical protein
VLVLAAGAAACSGDDGSAGGGGGDFCELARRADEAGDVYDAALAAGDPAELQAAVDEALAAAQAAAEVAPTEIADTVATVLDAQERTADLLAASDFDVGVALLDDEFVALARDDEVFAARTRLDAFLEERCSIAPDSSAPRPEFTLSDDPTTAADQFVRLYEIGSGVELEADARACLVRELGALSPDDLQAVIAGTPSEDASIAVGIAFSTCEVVPG